MNKKSIALMIAGGGCFLLFACCLLAGFGMYFMDGSPEEWLSEESDIENITVALNDVIQAKVGEDIILEIEITNTGTDTRNLDSIDLETTYLEGVRVNKAEPAYAAFDHVTFITEDFSTYDFQRNLPADSTEIITFYMTATKAGTYTGYVDVCIDSPVDCNRYEASIIVEK